jgi:hypothetical protein
MTSKNENILDLRKFLTMKLEDEIKSILLSLIGGARYGVKVRLPHAVIMTCLFRKDLKSSEKLRHIIKLVQEHATNLALFATLYKTILLILKGLSHRYEKNIIVDNEMSIRNLGYLRYCGQILLSILGMSAMINTSICILRTSIH